MISVSLSHTFQGFALRSEFEAGPGVTVLFGRSGSGKTTIVRALAGLLKPHQGKIVIDGRVLLDTNRGIWVPPHKRRIGYIFQDARLFPHLTVRQNLCFGRWFAPKTARQQDMDAIVEILGISHFLHRRPAALSGGEKQRVAIGRALLSGPELLLADEPLASLDTAFKQEIMPLLERLRDEFDVPILYVSHSATEVARLADRVVVLQNGCVVRQGAAGEVLGDSGVLPTGVRSAGAILQARIRHHHDDGLTELEAGGQPLFLPRLQQALGTSIRIRIAAQDVILSREYPKGLSALNILSGRVEHIRAGDGPGAIVSLKTPAGVILARITQRSAKQLQLTSGANCHAIVKSLAIAPDGIGVLQARAFDTEA